MLVGIDASRAQVKERTGTENYSQNLILALSAIDSKNSYRLYLRRPDKDFYDLSENFEKKVISLPRLWTQAGLAFEVLKNPPDLLFIPAHTLPIIRRPSLKTVVTVHDLGAEFLPGYHTFGGREYLLFSTRYAVKNATALIAVSQATKRDLIEKLGADPAKIFVIHEGVDHHFFKPQESKETERVKAKYKISGDYFLFVGTIQPRKNLVRLIEAFAKLGERKNLNLVLVGKKGWLADEIYQAPKKFKAKEKVRFLNYVALEDLPALYSGCLAFVLPSLVEGFGLPVLEAMACGAPVILSTASSLPEVGGNAALYIAPEDVGGLVGCMMRILDPSTRKELSAKSIIQARKFSWEKCAEETLKVFEKIYES
jgi:glycosyltransferase involved in cell wall biosynthesis